MAAVSQDVLDQLVVEVTFTTVVSELNLNSDGFGPSLVEAFFHEIAVYGKNGIYEIPKYTNKPHSKMAFSDSEKIRVTVEGLA